MIDLLLFIFFALITWYIWEYLYQESKELELYKEVWKGRKK
jgi:hypothetical protein